MNRAPTPCPMCARFTVTGRNAPEGHGYCEGYEKFRRHDDTNEACPLWIEKNGAAGQRIRRNETISRASAPTAAT